MYNNLAVNTLQNLLFCVPKQTVLHGKRASVALQKSRFRNAKTQLSISKRIIFTKSELFICKITLYKL
nr:hypothetical protein [Prevotella nigrescens]